MGLNLLWSEEMSKNPPNPDPYDYKILKSETVGTRQIIEVKYFGCTTFEGRKLLLLRKPFPSHQKFLDPHLLGLDHIVMARFEPTSEGWELARICGAVK